MPAYNCADYIEAAVQSVLHQTYSMWELLIIDDGSTDRTGDIIAPYLSDTRIRYLRQETRRGPAAARNSGLDAASGQYVAFLDSDDVWMPEKLQKQLEFMRQAGRDRQEKCVFSCTAYARIDQDGKSLHAAVYPQKRAGYWRVLFLSNPIGNSTALYDRTYFGAVRVPPIQKRNDFALWLALLRGGEACYGMQEVLAQYRVRSDSLSASKPKLLKYHWQLYREIERLPWWIAAAAILCWILVKGTGLGLHKRRI